MARSSYIYAIIDDAKVNPRQGLIAAFTVRHEMETWYQENSRPEYVRIRIRDGGKGDCVML